MKEVAEMLQPLSAPGVPPSSVFLHLQRLDELLAAFLLPKPVVLLFQPLSFIAHHPAAAVAVAVATGLVATGLVATELVAELDIVNLPFQSAIAQITVPAVVVFVGAGSESESEHLSHCHDLVQEALASVEL